MIKYKTEAPLKVLIKDVGNFQKLERKWIYKVNESSLLVEKVIVQGEILKTAGFSNEILIIYDGTGKAKVTRGSNVPGDLSWINQGMWCSIVGSILDNGKLPLINADKISKITNQVLKDMWQLEVNELKNILFNQIYPQLPHEGSIS